MSLSELRGEGLASVVGVPFISLEDYPLHREEIIRQSARFGFVAFGFTDADEEFYEKIKSILLRRVIPLIMLDISLGEDTNVKGIKACMTIRQMEEELGAFPSNIVIYSSQLAFHKHEELYKAGANSVIPKTDSCEMDFNKIISDDIYLRNSKNNNINLHDMEFLHNQINEAEQEKYEGRINKIKLRSLLNDKEWVDEHAGKYVAILHGELVAEGDDLKLLLKNLPSDADGALLEKIGDERLPTGLEFLTPFTISRRNA